MASAIGPARQALWEILQEGSYPDGTQVTFGWPDTPHLVQVALLGLTDPDEQYVLLGPEAPKHEKFGIEVAIKNQDPGAPEDQAAEHDLATFEVADMVRDLIKADRTLSGTVWDSTVGAQRSAGTGHPAVTEGNQHASGLLCVIEMTVACQARAR